MRRTANIIDIGHTALQRDAIRALMQGGYQSFRGALRVQTKMRGALFCASGVLCEVYRQHNSDTSRWARPNNAYYSFHVQLPNGQTDAGRYTLPTVVRNAYGLSIEDAQTLVDMNDGGDHFFPEIAEWLAGRWGRRERAA